MHLVSANTNQLFETLSDKKSGFRCNLINVTTRACFINSNMDHLVNNIKKTLTNKTLSTVCEEKTVKADLLTNKNSGLGWFSNACSRLIYYSIYHNILMFHLCRKKLYLHIHLRLQKMQTQSKLQW